VGSAPFNDGNELKYVAVSLEESTREGAGRGLILKEDVVGGTDLCEYGGDSPEKSFPRLKQKGGRLNR
jgi:hypothetical protein